MQITVFKGSMPFLWALVAAAIILTAFPKIATFLPDLIMPNVIK